MTFPHPTSMRFVIGLGALVIAAGCSDDGRTETTGQPTGGSSAGGSGSGGDDTGGASAGGCGAIGSACNGSCPDGLTCYAEGTSAGFCIPPSDDCGGFAGDMCDAATPVCMTLSGSDFGPCGTELTKECVCAHASGAIEGCQP